MRIRNLFIAEVFLFVILRAHDELAETTPSRDHGLARDRACRLRR